MKQIISVASQKGGVGKTTTTISLAAGLAQRGKKVLVIDSDSQANTSKVLHKDYQKLTREQTLCHTILDRHPLVFHETIIENLSLVPSHILLSETDIVLSTALDNRAARLKSALDTQSQPFDYVFIDCPPSLGWLTINALVASTHVLIPVSPGYFELDSIQQISKTLLEVRTSYNRELALLGLLFTMSDPTINSRDSLSVLRDVYAGKVLSTIIPRNTDIRDAHANKKDIFTFNPHSSSALAYQKLVDELFI